MNQAVIVEEEELQRMKQKEQEKKFSVQVGSSSRKVITSSALHEYDMLKPCVSSMPRRTNR
jgi:hypothetical protein